MTPVMESRVFEQVGEDFIAELCQRHRFEPIDRPAERHGSWEWAFGKRAGGLDRYVVIAFTSLPPAIPDADWYAIEVWAGAEKEDRYTRKPVSDFHAAVQERYRQQLRSTLKEPLLKAMSIADSLSLRDLDEIYTGPRAHPEPPPHPRRESALPPD